VKVTVESGRMAIGFSISTRSVLRERGDRESQADEAVNLTADTGDGSSHSAGGHWIHGHAACDQS
jgi:hypothetical protein